MNVNPTSRPSLGRAIGEANRVIGKLHLRALGDFGSTFPAWMLLTVLDEQDGPLPVDEVVRELDLRADVTRADALRLLERAAVAGHVDLRTDNPMGIAELTEAGREHFAAMYAHARKVTAVAFEGIDPADLQVALSVVSAAKERAVAELG